MERTRSFLDERRELLAGSTVNFNGIAGLEVDQTDRTRLLVRFVKPLPGETGGVPTGQAALAAGDITVTGGDRVAGIRVLSVAAADTLLTVDVDQAGDFSTYELSIDADVPGFDPILRKINFSFKVHCDIDLDCEAPARPDPPPVAEPRLDYLARDYESYRRMMLDRMAVTVPDWTERNPADLGVALVEWLAYIGDELSYKLDHVGTEYALETARLRRSAARHARLTGYRMHNGVSARVLAQVELAAGTPGPKRIEHGQVAFLTRSHAQSDPIISEETAAREVERGALAFEPLHDATLYAANHRIVLHHWGDADAILARGARSAYLRNPGGNVTLEKGDLLVLVQHSDPATGREADADPSLRQAVRLIADPTELTDPLEQVRPRPEDAREDLRVLKIVWGPEDALGFDLCVGKRPPGEELALALGNIILADHGFTLTEPELLPDPPSPIDPEEPPEPGQPDEIKTLDRLDRPRPYRPKLKRRNLTFSSELFPPAKIASIAGHLEIDPPDIQDRFTLNVDKDLSPADTISAACLLKTDPADAKAGITLKFDEQPETDRWSAERDLLGAGPESRIFVPEVSSGGTTRLRFGRGFGKAESLQGRTPVGGSETGRFRASYRIGTGRAGNIGAEALAHVAVKLDEALPIAGVRNPLPAEGGQDRETIAEVRQRAPVAFNQLKRAVTLSDYETLLTRRGDVQRAQARKRWLGSWSAIFITVDRTGGLEIDEPFRKTLFAYLEPFRMMGHDLTIEAPIYVPLSITLKVCATPDVFAGKVTEALEDRFAPGFMKNGERGFFHPDNITFSSEIFLSRIYEAALEVPGVGDVRVDVFQRSSAASSNALDEGVLRFGPREIPILSNDPNRPSEGSLDIVTEGGR